jgi:predicted metal-dependent hydrolase
MKAAVSIIRRPVKHARLRVRETREVELVVPSSFSNEQAQEIIRRKANWIEKQHEFFRKKRTDVKELAPCELQLFGDFYKFIQVIELGRKVVIDPNERIIQSGRDLSNIEELRLWYRSFARQHLSQKIKQLGESSGLTFNRLFILSQRTRWGGCSPKRNISLNWRLVLTPDYVIDYVVLHELVHTEVLKHNQRFWLRLSGLCPYYKKAIEWLRSNGNRVEIRKN